MVSILLSLLVFCPSSRAAGLGEQQKQVIEVIKILLKPDKATVYTAETPTIRLQLLDAYNNEKKAPK